MLILLRSFLRRKVVTLICSTREGALRARNRLWVVDAIWRGGGRLRKKGVEICITAYLFGRESFEEEDCHGAKP